MKEDGTVWTWGRNSNGLGIGSVTESGVPIKVQNLSSIIDISLAGSHVLALDDNGTVWAWGDNYHSQCGIKADINTYNCLLPIKVEGLTDVKQVAATSLKSFALKEDGTVWAWGGNGMISTPTILNQLTDVKSISSGNGTVIALTKNGDLFYHEDTMNNMDFVQIKDRDNVVNNVEKVVNYYGCILIIKKDGTVWASITTSSFFRQIDIKNVGNIKEMTIRFWDCAFLMNDGTVWECTNLNHYSTGEVVKANKIDWLENIEIIYYGGSSSFAIKEDGSIIGWGSNKYGNLGDGVVYQNYPINTKKVYIPNDKSLENESGIIEKVSSMYYGSYQLKDDGRVELSSKGRYNVNLNDISNVIKIDSGSNHILALKNDGTVWAWGGNSYDQLGDGSNEDKNIPVQVNNLSGIISIATNSYHSLALKNDGTVWAWGENRYGQLGNGTSLNSNIPAQVKNIGNVISIAASSNHSLALKEDGTVWAWGNNNCGQLGNGIGNSFTPVEVTGLQNVIIIGAGDETSTFTKNDLTIWSCGDIDRIAEVPVKVSMEDDADLKFITINDSFLEAFNEDLTDYNIILPVGTAIAPNIHVRTRNPNATYDIIQPDKVDGIAIIKVTAPDGVTEKEYRIQFNKSSYAEYKESYHFGESGTGASGNFSRTYTDMIADVPGFKLVFSRTYNSKDMKIGTLGRGWTFGFESKIEDTGNVGLKKLTLPDGSVNLFKWDGSKYVAENSRNTLTLDASDTYLLTTKDQYTYHYNKRGHLDWMKDRNGNIITIDVSSAGKVNSITDQCGRIYKVDYDNGMLKYITDVEGGRKIEYTYKDGNLRYVTDACNSITYYNYDSYTFDEEIGPVDILSQVRDNDNRIIEFIDCYETGKNKGKVSQTVDKNGNKSTYNYYPNESRNTVTDSNGKQTSYWYDDNYCNTIVIDSEGGLRKTTYFVDEKGENKYGEVMSFVDRNRNKTTYERDDVGNITKIKNPDKSVVQHFKIGIKSKLKFS